MRRRSLIAGLVAAGCSARAFGQSRDASGRLLTAVERSDLAGVEAALAAGAMVDARDSRRRTALLVATYRNDVAIARALIDAGADVNAKDDLEDSAFLYAGAEGRSDILRLTLAAGADLKSLNRYGGTALIPACHHGHVENIKILLQTAIDADHVNKLGWTALLEAVILGDGGKAHTEIVRLLIAHGVDVNLADRDGVTPLAHARSRRQREIASILEKAGAR